MRGWILAGGAVLSIALMSAVPFAIFSLAAGPRLGLQVLSFAAGLVLMVVTAKAIESSQ